ncbi:MAG: PHP domain-containing protein [Planctomycetes bacterium]|nr:PHP domain-containing protein [Planctomycetota bacterium]
MPERTVDLHAHTTASDGSLRPAELVRRAAEAGLAALAVTDHDTIDGLAEARHEAGRRGIELVNGVELSVRWNAGTFHLLGYLFRPDEAMEEGLKRLKALRHERNEKMIAKLNALGHPITMDEVRRESGGGQIGRPHMAKALVKKGVLATVDEAFNTLLRRGRPAYVIVERLEPAEAIAIVRRSGGVAVLAHPYQLRLEPADLDARVAEWAAAGLGGIEVQHSSHDAARQSELGALARRHGLAATGGSDFHGDVKPGVELGKAHGGATIPYSRLEELKRRLDR